MIVPELEAEHVPEQSVIDGLSAAVAIEEPGERLAIEVPVAILEDFDEPLAVEIADPVHQRRAESPLGKIPQRLGEVAAKQALQDQLGLAALDLDPRRQLRGELDEPMVQERLAP